MRIHLATFVAIIVCLATLAGAQPASKNLDIKKKIDRYFELVERDPKYEALILKIGKQGFPVYKGMLSKKTGSSPGLIVGVYGVIKQIPGARDEFLEDCMRHLTDDSPNVRYAATHFLAAVFTKEDMPLVVSMLYDTNPAVVYEALQLIGRHGLRREKTVLEIWLRNSPEGKSEFAKKDVREATEKIDKRLTVNKK